jgi:hypothetical protein
MVVVKEPVACPPDLMRMQVKNVSVFSQSLDYCTGFVIDLSSPCRIKLKPLNRAYENPCDLAPGDLFMLPLKTSVIHSLWGITNSFWNL